MGQEEDLGHQSDGDLNKSSILLIRRAGRAAGLVLLFCRRATTGHHVGVGGDRQREQEQSNRNTALAVLKLSWGVENERRGSGKKRQFAKLASTQTT